jgi:hypothetical protein
MTRNYKSHRLLRGGSSDFVGEFYGSSQPLPLVSCKVGGASSGKKTKGRGHSKWPGNGNKKGENKKRKSKSKSNSKSNKYNGGGSSQWGQMFYTQNDISQMSVTPHDAERLWAYVEN